ncbi:MAG: DUF6714 family protein [Planctomycetota bacterium]
MLPQHLTSDRDALVAEIHEAFRGVTRVGGRSWRAAYRSDYDGLAPDDRQLLEIPDNDRSWEELAAGTAWDDDSLGGGGFSFLDAIGFRYYLPAAMVRSIQRGNSSNLALKLTLPEPDTHLHEHILHRLSLLNEEQCRVVANFLQFMLTLDLHNGTSLEGSNWRIALNSHWAPFFRLR